MSKDNLKSYIESLIARGCSASEIARRCDISDTSLSQFRSGKYGANESNLSEKIAAALHYQGNNVKVVDSVYSYRQVQSYFNLAKKYNEWVCISSPSGSGKTQSLIDLYNIHSDGSVIYIKCREWSRRKLLTSIIQALGEKASRYMDNDDLLNLVVQKFNRMAERNPVLIIDDAGKLTNNALRVFIHLYDDTKDRMGAIVAGTETLADRIRRCEGRVEGFGELNSRLGRKFFELKGARKADVTKICKAYGISDSETIQKIWGSLSKKEKPVDEGVGKAWFATDLREMKSMIKTELIRLEYMQKTEDK